MMLALSGTIRWDDIPPGQQGALIVTAVFAVIVVAVIVVLVVAMISSLRYRWRIR